MRPTSPATGGDPRPASPVAPEVREQPRGALTRRRSRRTCRSGCTRGPGSSPAWSRVMRGQGRLVLESSRSRDGRPLDGAAASRAPSAGDGALNLATSERTSGMEAATWELTKPGYARACIVTEHARRLADARALWRHGLACKSNGRARMIRRRSSKCSPSRRLWRWCTAKRHLRRESREGNRGDRAGYGALTIVDAVTTLRC
jgi:hypothetical protein